MKLRVLAVIVATLLMTGGAYAMDCCKDEANASLNYALDCPKCFDDGQL